jgi:hypothetical protein
MQFPDLVPFVAREMRVDASKVDAKYLSGLTQSQLTQLKKKLDEQCEEELFAYLKTYVARCGYSLVPPAAAAAAPQ